MYFICGLWHIFFIFINFFVSCVSVSVSFFYYILFFT